MKVFTKDNALHLLGGIALSALIWANNPISSIIVISVFGWMREGAQHRDDGQWIGWITPNRLIEAISWVIGAILFYSTVNFII